MPISDDDPTDAQLRLIGEIFVDGVLSDPRAVASHEVQEVEQVKLDVGRYFWARIGQLLEGLLG